MKNKLRLSAEKKILFSGSFQRKLVSLNNDNDDTDNDDDTDDSDVNDSEVNNLGDTIIFGDDDSFIKNSVKRSFQFFFPF